MELKKELLKNILFRGANVLLSFITTVLLVRLLGTTGNGIFSLLVANTAIIALILSFSLNSGITYYTAREEFSTGALFNTVILILLIQFTCITGIELLCKAVFGTSLYLSVHYPGFSGWGSLYIVSLLLNGYLGAIFSGKKWFDKLNTITLISNAIFVAVFCFMLVQKRMAAIAQTELLLKIYILLTALQTLLSLATLLGQLKITFKISFLSRRQSRQMLTYSGIAFFCNFFQFLAYRMDYWFIDHFRGEDELGLYALASRLNQVLWLVPMTIAAVVIPFTVTASSALVIKIKIILRLLINSYALIAILLALLSPFAIPLIFGKAFYGTVRPFIILLPGVIIFSITTVLAGYFAGINRLDINLKISLFCFSVILLGDLFLVPEFGKEGAAIASSFGYALSGIYSLWVFSKQTGWGLKELLLVRKEDVAALKNIFSNNISRHE